MSNLEQDSAPETTGSSFGAIVDANSAPAETDGVADSDQPGVDATPETEAPEQVDPPDYLDVDENGDRLVKVKVDGEEVEVPLREALQGYQREADYTRKSQANAQALRLAQALQANPGLTMQALAAQQGMTVEQFLGLTPQQQMAAAQTAPEDVPPSDPLERRIWEQDRRVQELEYALMRQDNDARVRNGVEGLVRHYQADQDEAMRVVQTSQALSQQLGREIGPEMFPMVLQAMRYQQFQAQQQAQQQAQATKTAEEQARQAAAAAASSQVASGGSANGTMPAESSDARIKTIADAFDFAEQQVLGGR